MAQPEPPKPVASSPNEESTPRASPGAAPAPLNPLPPPKENLGSLLRLFKSDFFDIWMAVSYLYRYPSAGVHDYLCNQLYRFADDQIEFYLPQLVNMVVSQQIEHSRALERFVVDKCGGNLHLGLRVAWLLQAYVEDDAPAVRKRCERLLDELHSATVNHKHPPPQHPPPHQPPAPAPAAPKLSPAPTPAPAPASTTASATASASASSGAAASTSSSSSGSVGQWQDGLAAVAAGAHEKWARAECFDGMQHLLAELAAVSDRLRRLPQPQRQARLEEELAALARALAAGPPGRIYIPLYASSAQHLLLAALPPAEAHVLNSRERAPFLLTLEVLQLPLSTAEVLAHPPELPPAQPDAPAAPDAAAVADEPALEAREQRVTAQLSRVMGALARYQTALLTAPPPAPAASATPSASPAAPSAAAPAASTPSAVTASASSAAPVAAAVSSGGPALSTSGGSSPAVSAGATSAPAVATPAPASSASSSGSEVRSSGRVPPLGSLADGQQQQQQVGAGSTPRGHHSSFLSTLDEQVSVALPFGETLEARTQRLRQSSELARLPGWRLAQVIVKFGDELRQEALAVQLLRIVADIFERARLPLLVRPYSILITSARGGLIEAIPNVVSLHQLHKALLPSGLSLAQYFRKTYGADSHNLKLVQRNFAESLAGYSLVCYVLQVKDRHNGNILLDHEGRLMHIDFGFMLASSPGSLGFESAPFKLTAEFVEVLDGPQSAMFAYFRALCLRGFLELRKHMDRIVLVAEMMARGPLRLPCFYGGQAVLDALRDRFQISLTEDECSAFVDGLIAASLDNWRTRQYDHYQYLTNSIV